MSIKLKDLLKENFSGTMMGGVVSHSPFHSNMSLSKIVKEKYGDVDEQSVDIKGLTKQIAHFNKNGESIFGKSNITDISEKLSWIAGQAKSHTLQETDDWFDKITVNRNMKELTGLSKSFGKIAQESNSLQQRLGGLYEDMGHVLGRYFEMEGDPSAEDAEDVGIKGNSIKEGDYEEFFKKALSKFGVSSPEELDDEKKKELFNYVDANYKADNETD